MARTAVGQGARVILVEADEQLLPGRLPAGAAERVQGLLEAAGVVVRVGQPVAAVSAGTAGSPEVSLGDERLTADVVLAALGVRPETSWLPGSVGRAASGALLTDVWGRTSLPGVFALGDAASRWSPRVGAHLAGGHWTAAFHSAETVAPAIVDWLGPRATAPAAAETRPAVTANGWTANSWTDPLGTPADDPVPYTFSDLGESRLLVLGDASTGAEIWREQGAGWTVYLLDDEGRLAGVAALDRPRDVVAARKAMRAAPAGRPEVDRAALADPAAPPARCFPVTRRSGPTASR